MLSEDSGVGTTSSSVRRARFNPGAGFAAFLRALGAFLAGFAGRATFFGAAFLAARGCARTVGRLTERRVGASLRLVFLRSVRARAALRLAMTKSFQP